MSEQMDRTVLTPPAKLRISVVSNGNFQAMAMVRPLFDDDAFEIAGVAVVSVPPGPGGRFSTLVRLARRTGVRYTAYKLSSLLSARLATMGTTEPASLVGLCHERRVACRELTSINTPSGDGFLRSLDADVLVSVSSPERFQTEILATARRAAINLHWGLLPRYAGIAPYFWCLKNGEKQAGLTVHLMVAELDAGPVLRQRTVRIEPADSAFGLQMRLTVAGGEELHAAIIDLAASVDTARPQESVGRSYFSWPTPADVRIFRHAGRKLIRLRDLRELRRLART